LNEGLELIERRLAGTDEGDVCADGGITIRGSLAEVRIEVA